MRALPRERPTTLTAPPDGQTLETLIGDLQSEYGVPQYPQEYRITLKVAEEPTRAERTTPPDDSGPQGAPAPPPPVNGGPRREKAPGLKSPTADGPREVAGIPRRRRRRGRRRRGSGGGSGSGSGSAGGPPPPPS